MATLFVEQPHFGGSAKYIHIGLKKKQRNVGDKHQQKTASLIIFCFVNVFIRKNVIIYLGFQILAGVGTLPAWPICLCVITVVPPLDTETLHCGMESLVQYQKRNLN